MHALTMAPAPLSTQVHRSLLAGRDSKDPFKHIVTASPAPHKLKLSHEEVDVGKAEFAFTLPTCRHSQALDCAEDSAAWLKRVCGVR